MDDLVQLALRGTARQPGAAPSHPTDELLAAVPAEPPDRRLLLQAGARDIYALAGRLTASAPEPPAVCRADSAPACSPRAAEIFRTFLEHARRELLEEALELLARAGQRLPPALLPRAMDRCESALQARLVPVLGERGRWLCRFHPGWQRLLAAAASDDEALPADADRLWSESKLAERKLVLEKARRIEPPRARQWLAAVWDKEPADARNELLSTFQTSLSEADLPFLENALADGSKKVRATASLFLCRLPGSAVAQRMRALGETLLAFAAPRPEGKLKSLVRSLARARAGAGKLTVTPPKEFDKAWEKDGLVEKPPPGRGQREFWLTQVLERIPPTHWEERFRATPAELIAALAQEDDADNVLQAWSTAARAWRLERWALALCDAWKARVVEVKQPNTRARAREQLLQLFSLLSRENLEELVTSLLENDAAQGILTAADWDLLPRPWSKKFSQTYLQAFRERSQKTPAASAFGFLETVPLAAAALAPASFEEALQIPDIPDQPEMAHWRETVKGFIDIVRLRKQFLEETRPSGDSP
jgi:Family of unknown function (DUF5691)